MLRALEIFSGGGGLSLGLKRAGIQPLVAVELDFDAAETYRANHPGTTVIEQDIREVQSAQLARYFPGNKVDLLAACPPCQGFSSLTSKYRKFDERNKLVSEVARLAKDLRPTAIMFENVPGLVRKGKDLFDELIKELEELGYVCNWDVLQVADFGIPQSRRRLVLVAGLGFSISLPRATHSHKGLADRAPWRPISDEIRNVPPARVFDKTAAKSDWHIFRQMTPANLERLKHAKPGGSWRDIPENLRPQCHQGSYQGFSNAYGRMSWDDPAPTITGGCTSLSKGRVGHPDELRTLTVREAACLQTFPWNYKLKTDRVDKACEIVGNALPPWFAEVIAVNVGKAIQRAEPWLNMAKADFN